MCMHDLRKGSDRKISDMRRSETNAFTNTSRNVK